MGSGYRRLWDHRQKLSQRFDVQIQLVPADLFHVAWVAARPKTLVDYRFHRRLDRGREPCEARAARIRADC